MRDNSITIILPLKSMDTDKRSNTEQCVTLNPTLAIVAVTHIHQQIPQIMPKVHCVCVCVCVCVSV